jgi:hypothetical protein
MTRKILIVRLQGNRYRREGNITRLERCTLRSTLYSRGVLHATSRTVKSAGCSVDNYGSKEPRTFFTLTWKGITCNNGIEITNGIQGHCCDNVHLMGPSMSVYLSRCP